MKTLFVFVLFFSFSIANSAQTAGLESGIYAASTTSQSSFYPAMENFKNTRVVDELRIHLKKDLKVPEIVMDYGIRGRTLVNIRVDNGGNILAVDVVKSVNRSLDTAIRTSLNKVKKVSSLPDDRGPAEYIIQLPVVIE